MHCFGNLRYLIIKSILFNSLRITPVPGPTLQQWLHARCNMQKLKGVRFEIPVGHVNGSRRKKLINRVVLRLMQSIVQAHCFN